MVDIEELITDALTAVAQGDSPRARALLAKAEEQWPGDRDVALLRATVLVADDAADEAVALLDTLLEEDPDDPAVTSAKAAILLDIFGRADEARALLEDTADLLAEGIDDEGAAEMRIEVLLRLVEARGATGDPAGALAAAVEARALLPESPETALAVARASFDVGDLVTARDLADVAARGFGDDEDDLDKDALAFATAVAAHARLLLGDEDAAVQGFARASVLSPDQHPPPVALEHKALERALKASFAQVGKPPHVVVHDVPDAKALAAEAPPRSPALVSRLVDGKDGPTVVVYRKNLELLGLELNEAAEAAREIALSELTGPEA